MSTSKQIVLVFLGFLILGGFVLAKSSDQVPVINQISNNNVWQNKSNFSKILVNNTPLFVEIADSQEKISKGLSGRKFLGKDEGMLFIFAKDKFPAFWMKDMNFPIDIIWINNGKIVGIEENVQPEPDKEEKFLKLYHPPEPVDMVLEVNAFFSKENGIKVGDSVQPD